MRHSALVGDRVLDFSLPGTDSAMRRLSEFHQLGPAVLLFIPATRAWTFRWQCWNYLRHYDGFIRMAAEIVVVAGDALEPLQRFQSALGLPFVFLSDADCAIARRYEIGHGAATFLIDRRGVIRYQRKEGAVRRTPAHRLLQMIQHLKQPIQVAPGK